MTCDDPGRTLSATSSVPSLAEAAAGWQGRPGSSAEVVPLRLSGAAAPLFLVHDDLGEVGFCQALIQGLKAHIPVHEVDGGSLSDPPARTLNTAAARHVQAIRTLQPRGPYRVAGRGLGGIVAYEIATQLMAHDQAVEFLALIDSHGPCSRLLRTDVPASESSRDSLDCPASPASRSEQHRRAMEDALAQYAPQPIPVRLHRFVPAATEDSSTDPLRGWVKVLPHEHIEVVPVPGAQQPSTPMASAGLLAATISNVLKKVSSDPSPPHASAYTPLLTIQSGQKDHTPFFYIPGAGDNVTTFMALAAAMGTRWPLHGFQPRGLEHNQVPHASVQAAAACYTKALLKQCPDGQCHLLGHSFGGWVAFEMAAQLRRAGRSPLSVTLVDTQAPTRGVAPEMTRVDVLMCLVELLELGLPRPMNLSRDQFARIGCPQQLALLHDRMVAAKVMPARSAPQDLDGMLRTLSANLRTAYVPSSVSMEPVQLVQANDTRLAAEARGAQQLGTVTDWQRWAPNLQSWLGPGNHLTILRPPHVEALADRIRTWLPIRHEHADRVCIAQ